MVTRLLLILALVSGLWAVGSSGPTAAAVAPTRTLSVSGSGTSLWPAYSPDIERYAVSTTTATEGTLRVRATTSDPAGRVWIGGILEDDGEVTLHDLEAGDEIPVFVEDSAGRSVHSVVYLPADFPRLEVTTNEPGASEGHVFLTLNRFDQNPRTAVYETAVDRNGVPVFAHANRTAASQDFKPTGRGGYQVFRGDGTDGAAPLVELDARFEPVRSVRTAPPLTRTDAHDAILLPDGSRIMAAYEPDRANHGREDSVIQHIGPDGDVLLTWNSADHMKPIDPTLTGAEREAALRETDTMNPMVDDTDLHSGRMRTDYAHINSWELVDEGQNLLVSFRHTSSLMKIAWLDEQSPDHEPGDVIWRLGGKFSDFEFVDDPHAGPCAQHTGSQLESGNILIFDNGSPGGTFFGDNAMCPDPDDPAGEPIGRSYSRITEYALDEQTMTARLVREFTRSDPRSSTPWFALFAGGVDRLENGHDMISWSAARTAIATEVDPGTGEALWEIRDARDHGLTPYFSYRATKALVPDVIDPELSVEGPVDGVEVTQGDRVPVNVRCSDRGGSSLHHCGTSTGDHLDTTVPGEFTWIPTARDGAGNEVTGQPRRFTVLPEPPIVEPPAPDPAARPDLLVRAGSRPWVGNGVYRARQQVNTPVRRGVRRIRVRLQNDGDLRAAMRVRGPGSNKKFRVDWFRGKRKITAKVRNGTLRMQVAPGGQVTLRAVVARKKRTRPGTTRMLRIRAHVVGDPSLRDVVRVRVRARGRP